ncbi:MAG: nucleotidyl transferase AbiEii/AbiGii toxin family protein [Nitrososphaerota archaeon]
MWPSIPLAHKLRKRIHRMVAQGQDLIAIEVYNFFPDAVMHGGTAIWRCYRGNRFSEDIDFYMRSVREEELGRLTERLRVRGVLKQKIKLTENAVFSKFTYMDAVVRFEARIKKVDKFVVRPFELFDGSYILVRTLEPEDLVVEKVRAYLGRRRVRDLYDVFFLLQTQEVGGEAGEWLRRLVNGFRRPVDEDVLRTLVVSGVVPSVDDMLAVFERWVR